MDQQPNKAVILRLAKYLRVLKKLKTLGFVKVFSNNLGDAVGVTPAVVRKDFSLINIPGNKRGGYNIDVLIEDLGTVLGKERSQEVVLVGCGKIGSALIEYKEFQKEGIKIIAAFDNDPEKVDPNKEPTPVYDISEIESFVREHEVRVGVISVPDAAAAAVFDQMVDAGIRGFLNFTSVDLKCTGKCDSEDCPIECTVHNVNIGLEIENLFYLVNMRNRQAGCVDEDDAVQPCNQPRRRKTED
jgi:redox-sensing transcriptional repressor